jgi:chemotaxis protein methyltransferase CheR
VTPGAFFREPRQLALLVSAVLPELAGGRRGRRELRLWSAGCGAGEDAWSLAMTVEEARLPAELAVEIVATDGDPAALSRAAAAVYDDQAMKRVDAERRRRHFVRGVGSRRGLWRVIAPLRDRVELYALDLADPWPASPPFDAVFCHAPETRDASGAGRLARRFAEVLAPGGALFLGGSPAVPAAITGLAPWRPGVYRKRNGVG